MTIAANATPSTMMSQNTAVVKTGIAFIRITQGSAIERIRQMDMNFEFSSNTGVTNSLSYSILNLAALFCSLDYMNHFVRKFSVL